MIRSALLVFLLAFCLVQPIVTQDETDDDDGKWNPGAIIVICIVGFCLLLVLFSFLMKSKHVPKEWRTEISDLDRDGKRDRWFDWLHEFKKFALKGSVIDTAVGLLLATGFKAVVSSLNSDIIMPVVGFMMGGQTFSDKYIKLTQPKSLTQEELDGIESLKSARDAGLTVLAYGNFIDQIIELFWVGVVLFLIVQSFNKLKDELRKPPPEDEKAQEAQEKKWDEIGEKICPYCLAHIPTIACRCQFCTSLLPPRKITNAMLRWREAEEQRAIMDARPAEPLYVQYCPYCLCSPFEDGDPSCPNCPYTHMQFSKSSIPHLHRNIEIKKTDKEVERAERAKRALVKALAAKEKKPGKVKTAKPKSPPSSRPSSKGSTRKSSVIKPIPAPPGAPYPPPGHLGSHRGAGTSGDEGPSDIETGGTKPPNDASSSTLQDPVSTIANPNQSLVLSSVDGTPHSSTSPQTSAGEGGQPPAANNNNNNNNNNENSTTISINNPPASAQPLPADKSATSN